MNTFSSFSVLNAHTHKYEYVQGMCCASTYQKADEENCCVILNKSLGTERKMKVLEGFKLGYGILPQMAIKLLWVDLYHWKKPWKLEITNTEYFFSRLPQKKYVFQQQSFRPQKWNIYVRSNARGMLSVLGFHSICLDFPSHFCCQSKVVCRALANESFRNSC